MSKLTATVAAGAVWALATLGCEADLIESSCVGGDGTCDDFVVAASSSSASVGSGGGGGAGGGGAVCFEGCDIDSVSGNTGEFPCAVEAIMVNNCQRCHSAAAEAAPFNFDTYEDSQQLYENFTGNHPRWYHLVEAVNTDFMPLAPPLLTPEEKKALIDDWACKCAPPRESGVTCE